MWVVYGNELNQRFSIVENRKEQLVANWWLPVIVSIASILASSGFWAFVQSKDNSKSATQRLLMGLAYDKVTALGMYYLRRGWITRDEFDEYQKYFVEPYIALGGNGVAERIYKDVARLPFHSHSRYEVLFGDKEDERYISNVPVASNTEKYATDER